MARIKYGGRVKGQPNKTTAEIREKFQELISKNLDQFDEDLKSIEPLQRLKIIIELSKFVVPTLKATELTTTENEFKPVIINLGTGIPPDEIRQINDVLEQKY